MIYNKTKAKKFKEFNGSHSFIYNTTLDFFYKYFKTERYYRVGKHSLFGRKTRLSVTINNSPY